MNITDSEEFLRNKHSAKRSPFQSKGPTTENLAPITFTISKDCENELTNNLCLWLSFEACLDSVCVCDTAHSMRASNKRKAESRLCARKTQSPVMLMDELQSVIWILKRILDYYTSSASTRKRAWCRDWLCWKVLIMLTLEYCENSFLSLLCITTSR